MLVDIYSIIFLKTVRHLTNMGSTFIGRVINRLRGIKSITVGGNSEDY